MTRPPTALIELPAPVDDLCLRFANTRYWRGRDEPTETMTGPEDLRQWIAGATGIAVIDIDEAEFARVLRLREVVFRAFAAVAHGRQADPADIKALNAALAHAPRRETIHFGTAGRGWAVRGAPSVATLLAPVLWSAADLLVGPRAPRMRQCDNPVCQWLFLDDSKSGNRRWCDMGTCGNRAKARRHYARRKERASAAV